MSFIKALAVIDSCTTYAQTCCANKYVELYIRNCIFFNKGNIKNIFEQENLLRKRIEEKFKSVMGQ